MDKKEALNIILECSKNYNDNLADKHFLFLSYNKNKYNHIEVHFLKSNFLHLTGAKTKISARNFYNKCLKNRLSIHEFDFKKDGTTLLKLSVLPKLINITKISKMIGDYNNSKPKLYSDKLTGSVQASLGLVKDGQYYYPDTALKEDTRHLINNQERVIAIFSKNSNEEIYSNLEYLAKGIKLEEIKLPNNVLLPKEIEVHDSRIEKQQKQNKIIVQV
ncbi:PBECR4 domain-containing protein [Clostridium sporogenes]